MVRIVPGVGDGQLQAIILPPSAQIDASERQLPMVSRLLPVVERQPTEPLPLLGHHSWFRHYFPYTIHPCYKPRRFQTRGHHLGVGNSRRREHSVLCGLRRLEVAEKSLLQTPGQEERWL